MNKKKFLSLTLIIVILLSFSPIQQVNAIDWYNASWGFRKSHALVGSTSAGTNYQINITVHYGSGTDQEYEVYLDSKCQTDFDDIRFTDNDGTTLLDYFLVEKVDSDFAIFWVEVADNLDTNQDIFMYYNNSGASTASNGTNTFIDFDDFEDTDFSEWTVTGSLSRSSGQAFTGTYSALESNNGQADNLKKTGLSYVNRSVVCYYYDTGGSDVSIAVGVKDNSAQRHELNVKDGLSSTFFRKNVDDAGSNTAINQQTGWAKFEVAHDTSTFYMWINSTLVSNTGSGTSITEVLIGNEAVNANDNSYFDTYFIRKFVVSEPSHGAWGAETPTFTTPNIDGSEITDLTDGDTIYSAFQYYTVETNVSDLRGADTISNVYVQANDAGTPVFEMRATALNTTPVFSVQTGGLTINQTATSWTENGVNGTLVISFTVPTSIGDHTDLELAVFVDDEDGNSTGFTDIQTDYFDIVSEFYITSGLFYENGTNAGTATITTTLSNTTDTFVTNGTLPYNPGEEVELFTWDIGSGATRRIAGINSFETLTFTTPDDTFATYEFDVDDYAGRLSQGDTFLEAYRYINGTLTLIERNQIQVGVRTALNLVVGKTYILRVLFADGTRTTWGFFIPGTDPVPNIFLREAAIIDESFAVNQYITISITRPTTTTIQINYIDSLDNTIIFNTSIRVRGGSIIATSSNSNNTQVINAAGLNASLGYIVSVTGEHGNIGVWGYSVILDQEADFPTAPDISFLSFGGFDAGNLLSFGFSFLGLVTFSKIDKKISAVAGMIIATLMRFIGWSNVGWGILLLGWFVAILVVLVGREEG